ncbi:MAG TPA: flagellar protein FlaG [Symbiobacteriaceae bacterium]|nr:flagellar protein FlaG [Symbiobacteriaceae bacterium]
MKIQTIPSPHSFPAAGEGASAANQPTGGNSAAQLETAPSQPQQPEVKRVDLDKAVEKLNQTAQILNHSTLRFEVSDTHRIVIKVIDTESKEVIREIPPEAIMDALKRIDEYLGVLLDKRV